MANKMPKAVRDRLESAAPPKIAEDKLDKIRDAATTTQALAVKKLNLEQDLEKTTDDLNKMLIETLPTMMGEVGMTSFVLEKSGNLPAYEIKVKPFYRASIPKEWPEEKRTAAFEHIEERDGGDIIKTVVTFDLPKGAQDMVSAIVEAVDYVREQGTPIPHPTIAMSVHHATLSSWLKEEMELSAKRGVSLPKLDVIGAMVGKIATIKEKE